MEKPFLTTEKLASLIEKFSDCRIAVVGDFFLDKYLEVDPGLQEISVETGKPAHQVVGVRTSPGAAGTVVSNFASLGPRSLYAVGLTGEDGEGWELRKGLSEVNCDTTHLITVPKRHTCTYFKPRNVDDPALSGEHSRYDIKNRTGISSGVENRIISSIDKLLSEIDALVVMDQVEEADCGVVTARLREVLAQRANNFPNVLFWADSRRFIRKFRNLIIKPNRFEAAGVENPRPGTEVPWERLKEKVRALRNINGAPVVVTRGERGMVVTDPELTAVPSVRIEGETDPTGAGDSATAGTVLALCSGASLPEAALVGNLVASITVKQIGTTGTASREKLLEQLTVWQRQQKGRENE